MRKRRWIRTLLPAFGFLLLVAGPCRALDERWLVLPPTSHEAAPPVAREEGWRELREAVDALVLGVETVPAAAWLEATLGDTLAVGFYDMGEAMRWGAELKADQVVLAEWYAGAAGETRARIQRLNPYAGTTAGPAEGTDLFHALRRLEWDRWLFGSSPGLAPEGYLPPALAKGDSAVHDYLHSTRSYPQDALIEGRAGYGRAVVEVSAGGVPISVHVGEVAPAGEGFREAFQRALWAARWKPATVRGEAVAGVWRSTIRVSPVR